MLIYYSSLKEVLIKKAMLSLNKSDQFYEKIFLSVKWFVALKNILNIKNTNAYNINHTLKEFFTKNGPYCNYIFYQ